MGQTSKRLIHLQVFEFCLALFVVVFSTLLTGGCLFADVSCTPLLPTRVPNPPSRDEETRSALALLCSSSLQSKAGREACPKRKMGLTSAAESAVRLVPWVGQGEGGEQS